MLLVVVLTGLLSMVSFVLAIIALNRYIPMPKPHKELMITIPCWRPQAMHTPAVSFPIEVVVKRLVEDAEYTAEPPKPASFGTIRIKGK